ncbi:MerR family transcriptional regulator [Bacillus pseudomycoides]|uniref:MerR family transcriptional regulator n=1 Tax=Bacillus pseudomycoides TaxID=64104 RepID=UPI000BEC57DD|nr:MerR family transcriptional regulator [Bacillus pseudomycoides]PEE35295.1 MerR family transcriptional regulator [Bacillus pseudomycoides]PGA94735.1 MerR family transcriptional regulator [Bacillus pseudomycoides]PHF47444.1 MerR family transcriptional regulator [Bacillus pseudomycoides]
MSKSENYSIGEFSKRTGTSIRTLHYYDEIGLLKPEKHPSSGHRIYINKDILTLQKIVSLKFLGYSLDEICVMINMPDFNVNLKETLQSQRKAFEEKKEHIETSLKAINRTITLLEDEGQVDSNILMSLIRNIQKESEQRRWLEEYMDKEVVDRLYDKSEEEMVALDKEFIQLSKEVKRLFGKPVYDPDVQKLVDQHMKATLTYVGEEAVNSLSGLENMEDQYGNMIPSPYTKEEEEWLNGAMEYYMIQNGMYSPTGEKDK